MSQIADVLDRVRKNGWSVHIGGPVGQQEIAEFELAVGHALPPSFRRFIEQYGTLEVRDDVVVGISTESGESALTETESIREWMPVPAWILIVSAHEDGGYAIDFSRRDSLGECPIVTYEGNPEADNIAASNFDDWLIRFVLGPCAERMCDEVDEDEDENEEDDDDDDGTAEEEIDTPKAESDEKAALAKHVWPVPFTTEIWLDEVTPDRVLAWLRPFYTDIAQTSVNERTGIVRYLGRVGDVEYTIYIGGDDSGTYFGQDVTLPRWRIAGDVMAAAATEFAAQVSLMSACPADEEPSW
jgi:hypothetical protein